MRVSKPISRAARNRVGSSCAERFTVFVSLSTCDFNQRMDDGTLPDTRTKRTRVAGTLLRNLGFDQRRWEVLCVSPSRAIVADVIRIR